MAMPLRLQRYDNFGNYTNNWGILCEKLEEELNTQRRDYNDNTDNMYARQQCERKGEKQLTIWGGGARETQHVYRGATDCGDSANHRRNAPQNATSGAH